MCKQRSSFLIPFTGIACKQDGNTIQTSIRFDHKQCSSWGRGGDRARDGLIVEKGCAEITENLLGRRHESKTHRGIFDIFNSKRRLWINEATMACFIIN